MTCRLVSIKPLVIWSNAGMLLIEPLGTNFSEILIKNNTSSYNKMHFKTSSAKCWPFCPGGDELRSLHNNSYQFHAWWAGAIETPWWCIWSILKWVPGKMGYHTCPKGFTSGIKFWQAHTLCWRKVCVFLNCHACHSGGIWVWINLLHKSHSVPILHPTVHHIVTEMCTRAHFCYRMVHCGIYDE